MHLTTPSFTIAILLQRTSASSIEWVVRTIARSFAFLHSWRMFHSYLLVSGSRPVVGSSRKTILGFETILMAIESLLLSPRGKSLVI